MKRIGFATGYDHTATIKDFAACMTAAEERNFNIGFFSETWALMRDSVTAMSAFALATKQMNLGCTQIVRLRSPVVMAQTAASLDELSGGRIILCPGAASAVHATRHGFAHSTPAVALKEWVDVFRMVMSGESVDYEGEILKIKGAQLGWKPFRPKIPLWFAATSTTGLRLAGKLGDGVLLNTVSSPEYAENAIRIVRTAAEEAGRDWNDFQVAILINTSVEDDPDAAIDAVRWEVANKFMPEKAASQSTARQRVGEPYIDPDELPRLHAAYQAGGKTALAKALSVKTVQGLTASGTPDDVLKKVQAYRDAGVHLPIVRPAAWHQSSRILDLFAPGS
ncbi:LLM class flavin-dependent oxidoreductase [Bradyrhizobium sp. URHD0069]|uniref:LLM class flavin-dependent oxidoreductase n=1 Tax=Bradyrhizobium sp. URHD0069 TaxID=1380355 RepID=UPI0004966A23|nr:LLM class flavin-dependent oxidoreductase [Bradyrhizobium sp. URHD0069]